MNYTLHQLEIFKKVVEHKSVTKASAELYLTQPAISIQLKKFQDQFPEPLFEVIGRQLYITEFGEEVANYAEKILDDIEDLNIRTLTYNGKLAGKLKIALVSTAKYVMPYFLTDFLAQNEAVTLSIDVTNKTSVINSLEKNQVDFALVSLIPDDMQVNSVPLMQNRLFLIGGKNHKPSKRKLSEKALSKLPMIYREKGSATRQLMEGYFKSHGLPNVKRLELTSNEALKQAIIAGLGYSVMPLIGLKNELKTGDIQIIPCKDLPITTTWNLIWHKSKKLSPTAQAYVEYLEEHKSEIIHNSFSWFDQY